jgi:hypothetical protein
MTHPGGSLYKRQLPSQSRGVTTIDAPLQAVNDCSE